MLEREGALGPIVQSPYFPDKEGDAEKSHDLLKVTQLLGYRAALEPGPLAPRVSRGGAFSW